MKKQFRSVEYLRWLGNKANKCVYCGAIGDLHIHHEPPKGIGGGNGSDYQVSPLCFKCHYERHNSTNAELKKEIKRVCESSQIYFLRDYIVEHAETEEMEQEK